MKKIKNTSLKLHDYFGANRSVNHKPWRQGGENPFFENALARKYNHSKRAGSDAIRMVFLNSLLRDCSKYDRLVKGGKPLWCFSIKYEGICNKTGYRQISFTLSKKSKKRFQVGEQHILVIPSRVRIYPKFWDSYKQRCSNFGSVFSYAPLVTMMWASSKEFLSGLPRSDFLKRIENDSPFKVGALVEPRIGLFSPWLKRSSLIKSLKQKHELSAANQPDFEKWCREADENVVPPGVIISRDSHGHGDLKTNYYGKERLKVQLGGQIFEDLHPNELNIITGEKNEI